MNLLTKLFIAGLAVSAPSTALGQDTAKAKPDTLNIRELRQYSTVEFRTPFMSDSIDVQGQKYSNKKDLSNSTFINRKSNNNGQVKKANENGFFTDRRIEKNDSLASYITTYTTNISSPNYEKGTLLIESSVPFRAFFNGSQIAQSNANMPASAIKSPVTAPLTITPKDHELVIQTVQSTKDTTDVAIRVRYVPSIEKESGITATTERIRHIDLNFMLYGSSLSKVSISPSGRYMIMGEREYVNGKHRVKYSLYKGNKKLRDLGTTGGEAWLPGRDMLYYSRQVAEGRELVAFNPETMEEEVLHSSIPSGDFRISTSGNYLIYQQQKEGPKKGKHATRVMGRGDRQEGFRNRAFISLFDLNSGLYRPITFGHRSTGAHDMSRDDKKILFSVSKETNKRPFYTSDFIELDITTMKADTLFANTSSISSVSYTSKAGVYLIQGSADAFGGIGRNLPEGAIVNTYDGQLFLYDKNSNKATALTKNFDPAIVGVKQTTEQFVAYFTAEDGDKVSLYRCDLATGKITKLSTKEDVVRSFDVSNDGKTVAYVGQSMNNSDRLYLISGRNNKEELIYDLSALKLKDYRIGEAMEWNFTMPNGDKVPGRYYLPPNFDENKKYPMIVYYYGGTSPTPRTFEGSYSPHLYAAQGYIVLIVNPSGATGYGQEYASRHVNAWGKRTADEIIGSVKGFCATHSFVNDKKIGCMGASYGGFMTQYLQTVTDIFAAAISHAGISAISSYWGEGFWGVGYSTVASADSYPWNNPELYVRQSPLFNADKINTPLLLLHGTVDTNVPDGESVQMYNALKILGKEVEFVRIYNQDHFILETPKRIEWTNSIFAWFAKWLKDDPTWWNDMYPKVNL
ncbi:prolyl oligopeptidase family serine peptidase [Porphyromonas sp.]|uniref:S9 family peptidase n=1 Tax=Porphyromonas sp. TaxID=1924944 RepID=UPI0026DCE19C|nr:prolyl oligopeptidase family serine peptidase [Porphyromonas sp.]MDO4695721.1 prolyl oligopeptidase family serine peptidase [Porphyromonas sp.]MDO4771753.1 prolyl oligopeptidase family serine peptidase [Porphyromonas sp.]